MRVIGEFPAITAYTASKILKLWSKGSNSRNFLILNLHTLIVFNAMDNEFNGPINIIMCLVYLFLSSIFFFKYIFYLFGTWPLSLSANTKHRPFWLLLKRCRLFLSMGRGETGNRHLVISASTVLWSSL